MREKTINVHEITRTYHNGSPTEFLNAVSSAISFIEERGNRAEVHYATAASGSSFIQSAIIIEREEL